MECRYVTANNGGTTEPERQELFILGRVALKV